MAQIIRDPRVQDNIHEVDVSAHGWADRVRSLYEDGALVLLKGKRLDLDYAGLNALDFDIQGPEPLLRKIKKFEEGAILAIDPDSLSEVGRLVFEQVFAADRGRLRWFQEQVRSGDAQIATLYEAIFPTYRDFRRTYTWRFTQTLFENLHWDNFHKTERFHQVRIFCNIDRRPRLWRTSHSIELFAGEIYASHNLRQWAEHPADTLNVGVNNKVLGGMQGACLEGLPKHHIAFEQGDIWLAETRIVAHQIYWGQRAIASMFYVDPESMDAPSKAFDARIAALHARHGEAVPA